MPQSFGIMRWMRKKRRRLNKFLVPSSPSVVLHTADCRDKAVPRTVRMMLVELKSEIRSSTNEFWDSL
jgi:hypothetical protein